MADEPVVTAETTTATVEAPPQPDPPKPDPPDENIVGEAKRRQKQAEKEAADLRERLEALEDRDKSETERERKAREKAEERADELSSKVQSLERGGWLRAAAAAAGFEDPSDAEAFIDKRDIESEADAKRAAESLAKRKPRLLREADPTPPQIGRVLENGKTVSPESSVEDQSTEEAKLLAGELGKLIRR